MRRTFTVWNDEGANSNQAPNSLNEVATPRTPFLRAGFALTPDIEDLDMDARHAQGFGPTEKILHAVLHRTPDTERLVNGLHFVRGMDDYEIVRIIRRDYQMELWLKGIDHAY